MVYSIFYRRKFRSKLPTIWTDEKQRWEESERRRESERISKKRKPQKEEDPGARKGKMENCTPLWREAHVEVNMHKAPQLRSALWRKAHLEVKSVKN